MTGAAAIRPAGRWLHRLAVATATSTFVLILMGGLVTSTGSALAVPDWPTTFGYNMFLFPWSRMVGGILYEHVHRLIGAVVGLLTLSLAISIWVAERRRWVRWLAVGALAAVAVQGILGGLRVVVPAAGTELAIVHGCLGQAFFALTATLAVVTSRGWEGSGAYRPAEAVAVLRRPCVATTAMIYGQIVVGAILTHTGTWLGAHLVLAVAVVAHVGALVTRIARHHAGNPILVRPAAILGSLVIVQLLLGLGSYLGRFTAIVLPYASVLGLGLPIAHRLAAALILATCLLLTLRVLRGARQPGPAVGRGAAPQGVPA
jgi:cytochrome c oxidase assembly protein subunit 15